ncbi:hypothetical protein Taro_046776, partial [Colocasia esculenta]|nr:hypothetical protein [Colocasia esculenta]
MEGGGSGGLGTLTLLSGEDNNRFSSGLRSYSLPKFELDEHFQVHLRFDSVVQPESLLGIQDQEENSWIEDFSSGNGTLEFTLSAAESCSISRRKNVWSEATSSESVEILLRSVGEDDMISKETDIFDLDAQNGLSSASKHMDPSSVPDVSLQSKDVKVMNTDPMLSSDENEKDLSRINKGSASDLPDVDDVPNTFNDEELRSEMFEELDEGRRGGTCGDLPKQCNLTEIITLPTVESFATNEKSCEDSPSGEAVTDCQVDNVFVEKNAAHEHATSPTLVAEGSQDATGEQIDPSTSPPNTSFNDSQKISAKQISEQVTENDHGPILMVMSQKLAMDDDHKMETGVVTCSVGDKNELSGACKINPSLDSLESSSSLESKAKSSSFLMEECNEHIASEKSDGLLEVVAHQIDVLCKGNGMSGQILTTSHEACSLVIGSEINMGGHSIKNCNSDDTGQSMSLKIDSFEQAKGGSAVANFETKVPLEKDGLHVGNVLLDKNTMGTEDCAVRKLGKPVIISERNEDAQSRPSESGKTGKNSDSSVELHNLKGTECGARGAEEKEDSLGINLSELTSHCPESSAIQRSAEDEVREKNRVIVGNTLDASEQVIQETANPPNLHEENCENAQMSPLQDATSPEKSNVIHEPERGNSGIHVSLLPENACIKSSAGSDNLDSHMKGKPQGASTLNQNTQTEADHMEGQPAGETTQEVTGNAVNCKENSLHSVSFSNSFSEHRLLEGGEDDPSCLEPRCGSPTVISSSQHSSGEVAKQELNRQLSDPTPPVSGDLPQVSRTGKNSRENKSNVTDPKEGNMSEEKSFTFEVGSLADVSERASVGGWKPFPIVKSYEPPQATERCSSGLKQTNPGALNETPDTGKITQREKSRSVSGTERSTASKRKSVKVTPTAKEAAEKDKTLCNQSVSTINKDMQLEEKRQYSYSEGSGVKPTSASSLQTSKLPDLNTGTTLFHQPFTDLQQVQLRAQIFVYGSLIQGIPPDEACMISAFGNADGTRNVWDGIWRVTLERFHSQKTPTANMETPLQSHSGVRIAEQVSRSSPLQSKTHMTPVSRTNAKGASTVISSFMSLPSPLWSVSPHDISQSNMSRGVNVDPSQMLSPLHGYQSSHGKQYGSVNTWLSQASPVPWLSSSQSSPLDNRMHFLPPPAVETVQVTPVRDSSILQNSNLQFLTPTSFSTSGVASTVAATSTVPVETSNRVPSQPEKHASGSQKTRKRRKNTVSEAPVSVPPVSQPCAQLDSAVAVAKHVPSSTGSMPAISSSVSPTHFQIIASHGIEQKVIFSEETSSKIEQARLQAEDAAAFAASAIRHMEGIWGQLATQKNSGLGSEIETKLASAAVAAAAASSVAKAAAAAAKVASDAALQAKMMVDEALSGRVGNSIQGSQSVHTECGTNVPKVTPFSVKGKDKTNSSSSVISAAKEAARRRVEAASAASKRAENLDAIVKAAELAALAVCQAGAVIAMGDPLPFTLHDLVNSGPENYWKAQHPPAETAIADTQREKQASLDSADGHKKSLHGPNSKSSDKEHVERGIDDGNKSSGNELRPSVENQTAPDYNKNQKVSNLKEKSIQEGSVVEVCLDEDNPPRRVWCSAKILSLLDGKAYVCSSDFYSNAGTVKLKDWISLQGEDDKPPRIRIPHPTTAVKFEGTRKRRRSALGNYVWAVGDRVDAWLRDCWCEGVVMEKSKEDETKLTVCFSG